MLTVLTVSGIVRFLGGNRVAVGTLIIERSPAPYLRPMPGRWRANRWFGQGWMMGGIGSSRLRAPLSQERQRALNAKKSSSWAIQGFETQGAPPTAPAVVRRRCGSPRDRVVDAFAGMILVIPLLTPPSLFSTR
jgi:hypothetical protein